MVGLVRRILSARGIRILSEGNLLYIPPTSVVLRSSQKKSQQQFFC